MYLLITLSIIVINYLRKSLRDNGFTAQGNRLLLIGLVICASCVVLAVTVDETEEAMLWLSYLIFLTLTYLIFTRKMFDGGKQLLTSMLPLVAIKLIGDLVRTINGSFYEEWNNYFETAALFGLLWLVAYWFITKRQRKALEQERLRAQEKEKEYRITEKIKAELEVQVAERTLALTAQTEELQKTIVELKAAQAQLIHAEKMASLGELTAGIAHEIQNPLNFVNNFSELSAELIDEMNAELAKGDMVEAKAISLDLKQNLEKINFHGKRADGIVKGMLQHSRVSSGQKEPTDINALCDEYLRLSYHGLRAKNKSFNANFKTDFDASVGKVNIIPQDIGRVVMNLVTNAFHAVSEKKQQQQQGYEPTVVVSTRKIADSIEVRVSDNGNGVPQQIIDKIFQPFFTTKPTGQGTGLGLSLSYDIVVKGHGGALTVDTKEGEGTSFIMRVPVA